MSTINSGILYKATPLTEAQEGALQKEVVADQKAFAYLNSNKELCFALSDDPQCIKELAFDRAQHWYKPNGTQIHMDEYRRSGVGAYYLYQKYYCAAPDSVVSTMQKIPMTPSPGATGLSITSSTSSGVHVTGYNTYIPDILHIPALINGGKVTYIDAGAFASCDKLTYVNIPPTITTIEGNAFANCPNLIEVDLGSCEADISSFAFCQGGTALTRFSVGTTNKRYSAIDGVLFDADKTTLRLCPSGRTECVLPDGTLRIASNAFLHCAFLTSVVIPASVTHIDPVAFAYLPSSFTTITYLGTTEQWNNIIKPYNWRDNTTNLQQVQCSDGIISLIVDYLRYESSNLGGIKITGYRDNIPSVATIPDTLDGNSVTEIATYAFNGCTKLVSVSIAPMVESIGHAAFSNCTNLTDVYLGNCAATMGNGATAFSNTPALRAIHVDDYNTKYSSVGGVLFNKEKTDLLKCPTALLGEEYRVPDGTVWISYDAIENCTTLKTLIIPASVKRICTSYVAGIRNCPNLTTIIYEGTVAECPEVSYGQIQDVPAEYVQCSDGRVTI